MQTRLWCERHNVEIADTFVDEGFSARTFDRPDMNRLYEFISNHYKMVDYLVVNDFTRFSRDAGEALIQLKNLQRKYQIKIASASEGVIVDYDEPGSFFYAGLRFLQAEDEINRNRARVNLGIYTAKKKEGRYLGLPPIGYKTIREGRKTIIVPDEEKAHIIRYIYDAFINNTPIYEINKTAAQMGMKRTGKSVIQYILKNFVYTGLIKVKAYKDNPEELVEGIHEPIITRYEWLQVQEIIKPAKPQQILSDKFPLRSVLLCHCGKPLTGAPSRSRSGRYYNYYKCKVSGHNNLNADNLHDQLMQVLELLSLPEEIIAATKEMARAMMEEKIQDNTKLAAAKKKELKETDTMLVSIEKKWIENQLAYETYQRWYTELTQKRIMLKGEIEHLTQGREKVFTILTNELYKLSNLKLLYTSATTLQKQQLLRMVFDERLFYKERMYRTPYIMFIFEHNLLKMKERKLLTVEKNWATSEKSPKGAHGRFSIEPLSNLLSFISTIRTYINPNSV